MSLFLFLLGLVSTYLATGLQSIYFSFALSFVFIVGIILCLFLVGQISCLAANDRYLIRGGGHIIFCVFGWSRILIRKYLKLDPILMIPSPIVEYDGQSQQNKASNNYDNGHHILIIWLL